MAGQVQFYIENAADRELEKLLDRMPKKVFRIVVRKASQKTGQLLKRHMQAATPVLTGALRKSWGVQSVTDADAGTYHTVAGIRRRYQFRYTEVRTRGTHRADAEGQFGREVVIERSKIPNFYARRVNERSKANKGFVQRAFRDRSPEWQRELARQYREGIHKVAKQPA